MAQCKVPVGWTAFGSHIEFTDQPELTESAGGQFDLETATAQLTVSLRSVTNITYFCGPRGASHPGTLYCSSSELITAWNSAGFKEISAGMTRVNPYAGGLGLDAATTPVLDVYAVANESYTIDGGREVSPWIVSAPAVIDLTPYMDIPINNVPVGTTSIYVELGSVSRTFTDSAFALGGAHTIRLTGILSQLGSSALKINTFNSVVPVGVLPPGSSPVVGMGRNTLPGVNLGFQVSNVPVRIMVDGNSPIGVFSGSYKLPGSSVEFSFSNATAPGGLMNIMVSPSGIGRNGYISVNVNGGEYRKDLPVFDMLRACHSPEGGTYTINIETVGVPVLSADSCTESAIRFSWSAVEEASYYKFYRNGQAVGTNINGTTFNYGIYSGTEFEYRVSAVNSNGVEGPLSAIIKTAICEIHFNLNGATGDPLPRFYVLSGKSVILPVNNYIKSGYRTTGKWATTTDGGPAVGGSGITVGGGGDPFEPSRNTVLSVEWDTVMVAPTNVRLFYGNPSLTVTWDPVDSAEYYCFSFQNGTTEFLEKIPAPANSYQINSYNNTVPLTFWWEKGGVESHKMTLTP